MNETDRRVLAALSLEYRNRDEIVERTGLPRTTVYDSLHRLVRSGRVERHQGTHRGTGKRGRGRVVWRTKRSKPT